MRRILRNCCFQISGSEFRSLSADVFRVRQFFRMLNAPDALLTALLILAGLSVIAFFTNCVLMSAGQLDYTLMLFINPIGLAALIINLGLANLGSWHELQI